MYKLYLMVIMNQTRESDKFKTPIMDNISSQDSIDFIKF